MPQRDPALAKHRRRRRLAWACATLAILVGAGLLLATRAGVGCWRDSPPADRPSPPALTSLDPSAEDGPMEPADLLEGDWEGEWFEEDGKMGGKLRCRVRRQDDGGYLADFDASFAKVLSFKSSVVLTVAKEEGKWHFEGSKDLGWLSGGVYTYTGYVTADEFHSTYDSRAHRGVYRMTRVAAEQTTSPQ